MKKFIFLSLILASWCPAAELPKLTDGQKLAIRTAQFNVMVVSDRMRAAQTEAADIQRQIAELNVRLTEIKGSWKEILADRDAAQKALSAASDKAFKEAKVSPDKWELDLDLNFIPKAKASEGKPK